MSTDISLVANYKTKLFYIPTWVTTIILTCKTVINYCKIKVCRIFKQLCFCSFIISQACEFVTCKVNVFCLI